MQKEHIIIIGAGPAGVSAAYYLLKNSNQYKVTIIEENNVAGGLSRTVTYHGNKMDIGGHRFFSKNEEINAIWKEILPVQGRPSIDDKILGIEKELSNSKIDPDKKDNVFLIRNRVSRILYDKKFFDYPINFNFATIKKLGYIYTLKCGFSYIKSLIFKKNVNNLEEFYINRFGKSLYQTFFKDYTEKVWGRLPSKISPEWGSQRAKNLSITKIIKDYVFRILHIKNKNKETSLIDKFYYPKYGPGQMWEQMALKVEEMGGKIIYNAKVDKVLKNNNRIVGITYIKKSKKHNMNLDYLLSSMPVKDLCMITSQIKKEIKDIAKFLPYRDFITIGIVVKKINLKNETKIKTLCNIIPDNWIYVQEKDIKMGRIQIFNNWSPYLVHDSYNTISLGLEYFCNEGDKLWRMSDKEFFAFAISELKKMNITSYEDVLDYHIERVKKAYPAYFDSYSNFSTIRTYLDKIDNLYLIGRNGQHRYNNMDHSMLTGILAAKNIILKEKDKSNIWAVNTEEDYIEEGDSNEKNKK